MRKEIRQTFSESTLGWLSSKPGLADKSKIAYRGEINRLAEHLARAGVREVPAVSRDAWWDYLASLEQRRDFVETKRQRALRPGSIQQARRITRDFFMWALEGGIIDWLPRLPDAQPVAHTQSAGQRSAQVSLGPAMSRILTGQMHPQRLEDCRAQLLFNLVFWGALKPAAITFMKVGDFVAPHAVRVVQPANTRLVELPCHIDDIWRHYREARRSAIGHYPNKSAPLIARLDREDRLTAWGLWAIFKEWNTRVGADEAAMTPRTLRAAYLDMIGRDGEIRLSLAGAHAGIQEWRVAAWEHDIPSGMVTAVNDQIHTHLLSSQRVGTAR